MPLKIEEDGRVFPITDSSQSIIDCFLNAIAEHDIKVLKNNQVKAFKTSEKIVKGWQVTTKNKHYDCRKLLFASGSNIKIWNQLAQLGHTIVPPVPSLFTFNINDVRIKGIQGVSTNATVEVIPRKRHGTKVSIKLKSSVKQEPILVSEGAVLITHWGLSGPAILKLSAWGATTLNDLQYNFHIQVNWLPEYSTGSLERLFMEIKEVEAKKTILKTKAVELPRRLWNTLVKAAGINAELRWADAPKEKIKSLAEQLTQCSFKVEGEKYFQRRVCHCRGSRFKRNQFQDI